MQGWEQNAAEGGRADAKVLRQDCLREQKTSQCGWSSVRGRGVPSEVQEVS